MKIPSSLLVVFFLLPATGYSENQCQDLFKLVWSDAGVELSLEPGTRYRVIRIGNPRVLDLHFEGKDKNNEEPIYHFKDRNGNNIHLAKNDLGAIREYNYGEKVIKVIADIIEFPIDVFTGAHIFSKLIFNFYRPLAQVDKSVEVYGHLTSSKSNGGRIANNLQRFDTLMLNMGFTRPEKTRVIVGKASAAPSMTGPFSLSVPTFNVWTRRVEPTIVMSGMGWSTKLISSNSVLYHERTHSILHATYSAEAWINKNSTIQEALADFVAAHMNNFPLIGKGFENDGKPIRNILERTTYSSRRETLLEADSVSYHDNSMIASHILWRLREAVGRDHITKILKSLLDDLNSYRDSYDQLKILEGRVIKDERQDYIYDIEYLMAVVLLNSKQAGKIYETFHEMKNLCEVFGLSIDRLEKVSRALAKSNISFAYSQNSKSESVLIHLWGAAGLFAKALIVYMLLGG